jgi:uncharacterized caspase-like protein
MRILAAFSCAVFCVCLGIAPSHADKRVALVIGNAAYRNAPALTNPKNDAEDVGRSLQGLGFETIVAADLDRGGMNDALDRFSRQVAGADIALVYYSGHGMQFAGKNFLLPVDARLVSADDVNRFRLMPLDDILEVLQTAKGARVVVLDACRNNPVEEELKRRLASSPGGNRDAYLTRGLGRISSANGLLVAYATQASDVAADGSGRNSPFTTAFLRNVGTPDIDLRQMLFRVQDDVNKATGGRQRPELSISLVGEFKLKELKKNAAAVTVPPARGAVADDGSRYAAIWDASPGPASIARHGLRAREYQQEFDKWTGQGYCPTAISGYQVGNDARYAAIFEQKKCPAFVARVGLTSQAFENESNTLVGQQGYRLKLLNGYSVGGVVQYAAIWEQAPGPAFVARLGLSPREYQEEFGKWTGQGYCLTHLSGYSLGNEDRYAAIFEQRDCPAYVVRPGLTAEAYQNEFKTLVIGQGYRLKLVSGYKVGGLDRFAAIWEKSTGPSRVARHALTSVSYQQAFDEMSAQGYRLTLISGY